MEGNLARWAETRSKGILTVVSSVDLMFSERKPLKVSSKDIG